MKTHNDGQRLGIKLPSGETVYYDIDADGRVYWLKLVGPGKQRIQRIRVRDEKYAEWVRGQAANAGKSRTVEEQDDTQAD